MKHNIPITIILLSMFLITQLIGLAVVHAYSPKQVSLYNETTQQIENTTLTPELPYGLQPPAEKTEVSFVSIVTAMLIAILLMLLLMKIKAKLFLRIWFFSIVAIAIAITINAFIPISNSAYLALLIALPLSFYKVFKRNLLVHNITELFIYPGLAAVFVPLLNIYTAILLLILISAYDIYAVWHSGFMQKMAKFQITELKFFAGYFIPYMGAKLKEKLKKAKQSGKQAGKQLKQKVKVNVAILGGGDVAFPIILAGVVLRSFGFFHALSVSIFALLSLFYLFVIAKKGKFYPAMPFITVGCLIGFAVGFLF